MKKSFLYSLVLCGVFLIHCAYFNTFYNAKGYYRKATYETKQNRTDKPTGGEMSNYQKAIEKARKLIDLYPKSKYVDDALLLWGKSHYYRHEYVQASRKFEDLMTDCPQSDLLYEANLWHAKTSLAMNFLNEAEERMNKLVKMEIPKKYRGDAYFTMGKLHEKKRDFTQAIEAYQNAVERGEGEFKAEATFALGANLDSLGNFKEAAEYFERVLKMDVSLEFRFEAEFSHARALKKLGYLDDAMQQFEELLGETRNNKRFPDIKLEIADCLVLKGDMDGAFITYQDIIQDHPRTIHSSRACYELARLHEESRREYDRALELFKQVRTEYSTSEFADSANVKIRDIQRFLALQEVIRMARLGKEGVLKLEEKEVKKDSLTVDRIYTLMDSTSGDSARYALLIRMGGKTFADSVRRAVTVYDRDDRDRFMERDRQRRPDEKNGVDWCKWFREDVMPSFDNLERESIKLQERLRRSEMARLVENPELKTFRVEEQDKNLFLLAELTLFRFSLPDSAANHYRNIIEQFPESPFAPQALYNLGYIAREFHADTEESNSTYRRLIEQYPESRFAKSVRAEMGLPSAATVEDSIQALFEEAEAVLLKKKTPAAAVRKYASIMDRYPDSQLASKAFYSMGWVYETYLDSLDKAYAIYDSLLSHYPETVYAQRVKKKVEAVKKEREKENIQLKTPKKVEEPTKEGQIGLHADSVSTVDAAKDTLVEAKNRPAEPLGGVRAIQNQMRIQFKGDWNRAKNLMIVNVQVNERGRATEVNIQVSSNDRDMDMLIVKILKEIMFLPGLKDGNPVPSSITLSIPLSAVDTSKIKE